MAEAGSNNKPIILDYLNEDCWRAVLDYVPVRDIIHTEHTSRRWQEIVLMYLKSVRFCIQPPRVKDRETPRNVCTLQLRTSDYSSFESWSKKLGPSVVQQAIYCDSEDSLRIIDNCPNLEVVTLIKLTENGLQKASQKENLKHLQRVVFKCCHVSDNCISQFLMDNTIQHLEINNNSGVTGQCLMSLQPDTCKSLVLKKCYALKIPQLVAAAEHLREVTKLVLQDAPRHVYNNIHLVLEKMPKLECLYSIVRYDIKKKGNIFTNVSTLSRLKYLYVNTDGATDEDLELVTESCRELRVLWLERCNYVTGRGVSTICRNVGERLIALCLWYCDIDDSDAALIVRSCPNLKSLDLYGCLDLSTQLLPRAAAARRARPRPPPRPPTRPLRLRPSDVYCQDHTDMDYAEELKSRYPELELHYGDFEDLKDYDMFWSPE